MRGVLRRRGRAPFFVAALLAVPLYFASLLAFSLRIDRPDVSRGVEHTPTSATEAKIWAAALILPAVLVAIGAGAVFLRRLGVLVSAATAIVLCLVLPIRLGAWSAGHRRRFPLGLDYLKDSDPSNTSSRGDWEHAARDTILSITHWTIAFAIAAALFAIAFELRRRRGRDGAPTPPFEAPVGAPDSVHPTL